MKNESLDESIKFCNSITVLVHMANNTLSREEVLDEIKHEIYHAKPQLIVSGSSDKSIKIWDAERGECLKTLEGHSGSIQSVAFSSDNKLILSGSEDKSQYWILKNL